MGVRGQHGLDDLLAHQTRLHFEAHLGLSCRFIHRQELANFVVEKHFVWPNPGLELRVPRVPVLATQIEETNIWSPCYPRPGRSPSLISRSTGISPCHSVRSVRHAPGPRLWMRPALPRLLSAARFASSA